MSLLQGSDKLGLQLVEKMTPTHVFVVVLVFMIFWMFREWLKDRREKQRNNANTVAIKETNDLLEEIRDLYADKIRNILSLLGVQKTIERYYLLSCGIIKSTMIDIYTENHIYDPGRKKIIEDNIRSTIKNLYESDSSTLNIYRYKSKRLNAYMLGKDEKGNINIDHNILSDAIILRLFEDKLKLDDMKKYIDACFKMFITNTVEYFESLNNNTTDNNE